MTLQCTIGSKDPNKKAFIWYFRLFVSLQIILSLYDQVCLVTKKAYK